MGALFADVQFASLRIWADKAVIFHNATHTGEALGWFVAMHMAAPADASTGSRAVLPDGGGDSQDLLSKGLAIWPFYMNCRDLLRQLPHDALGCGRGWLSESWQDVIVERWSARMWLAHMIVSDVRNTRMLVRICGNLALGRPVATSQSL